eukprot:1976956-Pyramimonas_sp.AAC.3
MPKEASADTSVVIAGNSEGQRKPETVLSIVTTGHRLQFEHLRGRGCSTLLRRHPETHNVVAFIVIVTTSFTAGLRFRTYRHRHLTAL